jgi:hypothetical protein
MFAALLSIVPSIVGSISDHFKDKRELKKMDTQAKAQLKRALTDANIKKIAQGQAADIEWEQTMAEGSTASWKDEFWTIVLGIPAVMSFIPGMDVYVSAGFGALAGTPEWYQNMLMVAIGAAFGVQVWKKFKK